MIEIETRAKKWGNSVGIILPKKLRIKPNEEIKVRIQQINQSVHVRDLFGKGKTKTDTEQLLKEVDHELEG